MNDETTIAAGVLVLALLAGGLTVWAAVVRRLVYRQPVIPQVGQSPLHWPRSAIIITFLWVGVLTVTRIREEIARLSGEAQPPDFGIGNIQSMAFVNLLLVAVLLFVLSEFGKRPLGDFGLHLKRWRADAGYGAAGYLAALPGVMSVLLITQDLRSEDSTHPYISTLLKEPSAAFIFWIAFTVVVTAPLAEELVFRVIVQGALRSKLSAGWSIVLSSLLFAGVHGFPDSLALVPLALVLGYVYERRRSYLAVVLLHALFNTQTLVVLLLQLWAE